MSKVAEYKGGYVIEETIRQRLMDNTTVFPSFNFLDFLPSLEIQNLLGFVDGGGLNQGFRNGVPNVLNLFLWQYLFVQISNEIAEYVDNESDRSDKKFALNKEYEELLKIIKLWPNVKMGSKTREEVLSQIWLSCLYYDAPEEEMNYWIKAIIQNYSLNDYKSVIFEMHLMMFLNPYFLLKY